MLMLATWDFQAETISVAKEHESADCGHAQLVGHSLATNACLFSTWIHPGPAQTILRILRSAVSNIILLKFHA